jgi:signal transduction histidine kinase
MNFSKSLIDTIFKIVLISISLLASPQINFAQGNIIDSLTFVIDNYEQEVNPDSTYAQIQYDLAMEYFYEDKIERATKHAVIALETTPKWSYLEFSITNSLGSFYLNQEQFLESLEFFKKAMEIAIKLEDPIKRGIVHYNLSTHYDNTSNRELSYSHLTKAYNLMIEAGDTTKTIHLLNAMATFDQNQEDFTTAEERLLKALEMATEYGDQNLLSTTFTNTAKYYLRQSDTTYALNLLKKSYAIDLIYGKQSDNTIASFNIARIYSFKGQNDSALIYFGKAKSHAENAHKLNHLQIINSNLFNLFYSTQNYDTLPAIFKDYQHVTDSILSKENLTKYAEAQNDIELMTNKQELALIQITNENNRKFLIMVSMIAVLLVIILIAVFIARNNLQKQKDLSEKLYQKTKKQKAEIENQQNKLLETNKLLKTNAEGRDRIMSLLAHDLRTPFSSINSLNHLINITGELNAKQNEYLDTSNKVIEGGLDLISDILDIYKLENLNSFDLDEINISRLLENSVEKLTPITLVKKQIISTDFAPNILFHTNREMIQSAIDNLLSNASKYSTSGKEITLIAKIVNNQLTIQIKDNGQGFSTEEKKILFDRFNKFTRSKLSTEPSTGLGLFLVKGFVEKLNGTVHVESESGVGSTFTLVFSSISK